MAGLVANAGMMEEATPVVLTSEAHIGELSPSEQHALEQEGANLAARLDDAAAAAYEAAAKSDNPVHQAELMQNASQLKGLAGSARSMSATQIRGGGLGGIGVTAIGLIAAAKAASNDARLEDAMDASEGAAGYNSAALLEQARYSRQSLRDAMMANGTWISTQDTFFNSATEAEMRTYEEQMKAKIANATGTEKTVLENELKSMTDVKWKQLNYEAVKGYESFASANPEAAQRTDKLYSEGRLLDKSGVKDPELAKALAIVDTAKAFEAEDKIREKVANGEKLVGDEAQLLKFLDGEGKNYTETEKKQLRADYEKLKEHTDVFRKEGEGRYSQLEAEIAKIRDEGLKAGKSPEEIEKEQKAAQEAYMEKYGYSTNDVAMQKRAAAKSGEEQHVDPAQPQAETEQQKQTTAAQKTNAHFDKLLAQGDMERTPLGYVAQNNSQNSSAAGQVVEIAPGSQSVATAPTLASQQLTARMGFAPDTMASILAAVSVYQNAGGTSLSHHEGETPAQHVADAGHVQQKFQQQADGNAVSV